MPKGLIALVLHAHLPYVRQPERRELVEERWLFEAISDTYVPLVDALLGLTHEGVKVRLTLSLSPTLVAMLRDPYLMARYQSYQDGVGELLAREERRASEPAKSEVLRFYRQRHDRCAAMWKTLDGDLLGALSALRDAGVLELMTSAATHAFLPLLHQMPWAVSAQIRLGIEQHRMVFGKEPAGFWLPECGWSPELEDELLRQGAKYVFLDSHGLELADPTPRHGVHAPVFTSAGLAAFARDPQCSKQVWSATEGYPADPWYREFFRDIGWERTPEELGVLAPPAGAPALPTGIKLHRITGPTENKALYDPRVAAKRAREHGADFVRKRREQVAKLRRNSQRAPLIVAPFDAELFGHWWLEGPLFLQEASRRIGRNRDGLELVTPSEYLSRYPENEVAQPSASSWGEGGHSEVWLCEENDWVQEQLYALGTRLARICHCEAGAAGLRRRALTQAVKEHLLAQSSDWTFQIRAGAARDYAEGRVRAHLCRVEGLIEQLEGHEVDESTLGSLEGATPIFPWLSFSLYS